MPQHEWMKEAAKKCYEAWEQDDTNYAYVPKSMKVVCMDCGKHISGESDKRVSHSLCVSCDKIRQDEEEKEKEA